MSAQLASRLTALSGELLGLVFDQLFEHDRYADHKSWTITSRKASPMSHALCDAGPEILEPLANWYYATWTFCYLSGTFDNLYQSSAKVIRGWLSSIDNNHKNYLRKITLTMHPSEILLLFAPPEASKLLRIGGQLSNQEKTEEHTIWSNLLQQLQNLNLSQLTVEPLSKTCSGPCNADLRTNTGWHAAPINADGTVPVHFKVDRRWIVKALFESIGRRPKDANEQRAYEQTWTMLHSSTQGFHRCDVDGVSILLPIVWDKASGLEDWETVPAWF